METQVYPCRVEVPLMGGSQTGHVTPWTMAQRRTLRPKVTAVIMKVMEAQAKGEAGFDMGTLLLYAEEELCSVAEATIQLPADLKWDELWWEDLLVIVQAIWETSIDRGDGQGMAGKALGAIKELFQVKTNLTAPKPQASPSSPDAGAAA